ncbi:hypothetical protein D3C72_2218430 [compost metagenome]
MTARRIRSRRSEIRRRREALWSGGQAAADLLVIPCRLCPYGTVRCLRCGRIGNPVPLRNVPNAVTGTAASNWILSVLKVLPLDLHVIWEGEAAG